MLVSRFTKIIRCQRGVVLPMAFLTMLILSALIIAFSMMAASEPMLANNQLQVAQARAVAESGVETGHLGAQQSGQRQRHPEPFRHRSGALRWHRRGRRHDERRPDGRLHRPVLGFLSDRGSPPASETSWPRAGPRRTRAPAPRPSRRSR